MFTSRSMVEAYQDCPRYRFNLSFLSGKGLTRVQKSVPLVTGGAVHRGVEHLMNRVRIGAIDEKTPIQNDSPDVNTAVDLAVQQYVAEVEGVGFTGKQLQTDKQQWFTFNEQKALTEALIRTWYLVELPIIVERYKVLAVEREIEPIELVPGVMWQAKIDAELQERGTGDFHNYSLKTCSEWNKRMEESYASDLQGVTEIWSAEEDAKRANGRLDKAIAEIQAYADGMKIAPKQLVDIAVYLTKKKVDKKISGIRFCFLVKGKWMVPPIDDPEAVKVTYSPLIRGYKNITPSGVGYAHSWNFPNPDNKSGKGALGRGWEPFNVWETEFGVKGWIEMLVKGEIQPECGDVVKQQVVTPIEFSRNDAEIEEAMEEVTKQEEMIEFQLRQLDAMGTNPKATKSIMSRVFPHNRKHCYFSYGAQCPYLQLCWQPEIAADPVGSGLYEIRKAHHSYEREQQ
jgi:hypothetical protein